MCIRDRVNNWSQNVLANLAGETLRLSGCIKTEHAAEAALWIQCWQRPWRLLRAATTSTNAPLYGSVDWTRVSVEVEAPAQTDFVVVRCVLLGQGAAWFDDLKLEAVMDKPDADWVETAPRREAPHAGSGPIDDDIDIEHLLEAGAALEMKVRELQQTNAALVDQLLILREELGVLRERMGGTDGEAVEAVSESTTASSAKTRRLSPPLVPHGARYEEDR